MHFQSRWAEKLIVYAIEWKRKYFHVRKKSEKERKKNKKWHSFATMHPTKIYVTWKTKSNRKWNASYFVDDLRFSEQIMEIKSSFMPFTYENHCYFWLITIFLFPRIKPNSNFVQNIIISSIFTFIFYFFRVLKVLHIMLALPKHYHVECTVTVTKISLVSSKICSFSHWELRFCWF